MNAWMHDHATLLWWLSAISVVLFPISILIVPWLVSIIPVDYFSSARAPAVASRGWAARIVLAIGKNLFGWLLLIIGLIMLFLPGQGLVTMIIGMMLIDFPRKRAIERWLILRGPVLRSINWLRKKAGRDPLRVD